MTVVEGTDNFDAELALGASGLLYVFNHAGVLTASDVHVARRLGRLGAVADDRVSLAAALAARAPAPGTRVRRPGHGPGHRRRRY